MLCDQACSPEHGSLVISLRKAATAIKTLPGGGIDDKNINNRILLPGNLVMEFPPEAWFDYPKALSYYNALKTFQYNTSAAYAEGVEYGWYRTVRMLYPKYTDVSSAQRIFDLFLVNEGRNMRDQKGMGIKAGAKAAIEAYANR